jgi:hypothetical protein
MVLYYIIWPRVTGISEQVYTVLHKTSDPVEARRLASENRCSVIQVVIKP